MFGGRRVILTIVPAGDIAVALLEAFLYTVVFIH